VKETLITCGYVRLLLVSCLLSIITPCLPNILGSLGVLVVFMSLEEDFGDLFDEGDEGENEEFEAVIEDLPIPEELGTIDEVLEPTEEGGGSPEQADETLIGGIFLEKPDKRMLLEHLNELQIRCLGLLEIGQRILENLANSIQLMASNSDGSGLKGESVGLSLDKLLRHYFGLLNELQKGLRYQLKYVSKMDVPYTNHTVTEEIARDLIRESSMLIARNLDTIRREIDDAEP
jgi:hypothetical protein